MVFKLNSEELMQFLKGLLLFLGCGSVQASDEGKHVDLASKFYLERRHVLLVPWETSDHIHSFVVVLLQFLTNQLH